MTEQEKAFLKAFEEDNVDLVEEFLQNGVHPDIPDLEVELNSPLKSALLAANVPMVKVLVEGGANFNDFDVLFLAALIGGSEGQEIIEFLRSKGLSLDLMGEGNNNVLHSLLISLQFLIEESQNIEGSEEVLSLTLDMALWLVDQGVRTDVINVLGLSPLDYALDPSIFSLRPEIAQRMQMQSAG